MLGNLLKSRTLWLVLLVLASIFVWYGPGGEIGSGSYVLSGHTPRALSDAQLVGRSSPNDPIELIVALNWRNEKDLDDLIERQSDPNSADFRKFLSPADFNTKFAPDQTDVDALVAHFQKDGITLKGVSDNRILIHLQGTVAQFEKSLGVKINRYRVKGELHFSNDADPHLPKKFKNVVASVIGLNSIMRLHSRLEKQASGAVTSVSGFTPTDIATLYNFPNTVNTAGGRFSGKGVTIAIATAGGYDPADVNAFWKQFGITRTGSLVDIHINGKATNLEEETTLDLQQVGAQAPGADIRMYIGADARFTTFTLVFNQIVVDNKADVVSISWGLCESGTGGYQMKMESLIFKQGVAQGMAFFAASGDDGAYDCGPPSKDLEVDYPSSDPSVTAVGGTSLWKKADGRRDKETAWSGSGGGASDKWPRPNWQTGSGLPKNKKRNSADVALLADPATGYAMYFQGVWSVSGGTSFAAPNWAGLWALATEAAGGRLGVANPTLYRMGNSADYLRLFHDITQGDNGDSRGPGYKSGSNWDHPTGWGVPDGKAVVDWLKNDAGR